MSYVGGSAAAERPFEGSCGQGQPSRKSRSGGSGALQIRRVLEDQQRREARSDLTQVSARCPHRVRGKTGIEGGSIVELHRRDEDEIRFGAEGLADAPHRRGAKAGRLADERQVFGPVSTLEFGEGVTSAVRASVEGEKRGHGCLLVLPSARVRATISVWR